MQFITYKCKKCGKEMDQRADAKSVQHKCPNASEYDNRMYDGFVPLTPKVQCNA